MLCSWCSANRPTYLHINGCHRLLVSQLYVYATQVCTTNVYPYSSPHLPDVDICRTTGWWLVFKIDIAYQMLTLNTASLQGD